tara:strand:+ start:1832 stop:2131 length:300 start_codon:yes stop_codon:yes gene_type:complete
MFEPIADKIIIKSLDVNETTQGGVILPDIAQEDSQRGEVVAVGPGAVMIDGSYCNMQTKPGDIVVYPKFGAKKLDHEGDEYLIIKENEVLTILKENDNE